jgi:hypothetical protein
MYALSTPTHPDHLADITAGMRSPAHIDTWEAEGGAMQPEPKKRGAHTITAEELAEKPGFGIPSEELLTEYGGTVPPKPVRPEYIAGSRTDPYGMRFTWGPIMETLQIGPYTILEHLEDTSRYNDPAAWERHGRMLYHVYVDGKDTSFSALSLDAALAGAIAYRREGSNSHAGDYFMRMVGGGD